MKRAIAIVTAGAVFCAVLVTVYMGKGPDDNVQQPTAAPARVAGASNLPAATPRQMSEDAARQEPRQGQDPATNALPAWMTGPAPAKTGALPQTGSRTAGAAGASEGKLDAALRRLQELQAANITDPKQVSQAILQVEQANGSPVLHGVRLDVLRQNLQIAEKMSALSQELQNMGLQPTGSMPSGSLTAAMQPKLEQLEALRKQLRTDIVEPGSPISGVAK